MLAFPRPVSALGLCIALFAVDTVTGQTTYVVDGLNRPGTSFLDLPAAEAAAQHGDVIVLRSDGGLYTPVTTSKGLTIVGDPSEVALLNGSGPAMTISGLPAGRDFVLRHCEIAAFGSSPARILVQGCLGRVHLQNVRASTYTGAPAIEIIACQAVTLRQCEGNGSPGLRVQNATVAIGSSRFYGSAAVAGIGRPAFPGVRVFDSTLALTDVGCTGGLANGALPPAEGIRIVGSSVAATGQPNVARFQAGFYGLTGQTTSVPAVVGQSSLLELDAAVILSPRGAASAVVGALVVMAAQPTLALTGNYNLFLAFVGTPGSVPFTIAGFPADPIAIPGIRGRLWIDDNPVIIQPGILAGGFSSIPETLLPSGFTFVMQVLELGGAAPALTTPVVVTSRQ